MNTDETPPHSTVVELNIRNYSINQWLEKKVHDLCVCERYLHQSLQLCSVCVQFFIQTAFLYTQFGHLSLQWSNDLMETNLNTMKKKKNLINSVVNFF